jgi:SAM-dependent methyltransferase
MNTIRTDFDRLAAFDGHGWNHNDHYHLYLLRYVPELCNESLDIGCGTGTFARLLARRSQRVLGLDLSPEMVRIARERSKDFPNIEYRIADVLEQFPAQCFDCIASIATLHHLPLDRVLAKMKTALNPGGVLLVLDLYTVKGLVDILLSVVAIPLDLILKLVKVGRLRSAEAERRAWDEHGRHDHYLHVATVRRICWDLLPGARVKRHLFWRYTIVWQKPLEEIRSDDH